MAAEDHDKVKLIVEETVQRVYLLDPDDPEAGHIVDTLKNMVLDETKHPAPPILGKRAAKGGPMPEKMPPEHLAFSRLTKVTYVIPDQHGNPSVEIKVTRTTIERKPVKS